MSKSKLMISAFLSIAFGNIKGCCPWLWPISDDDEQQFQQTDKEHDKAPSECGVSMRPSLGGANTPRIVDFEEDDEESRKSAPQSPSSLRMKSPERMAIPEKPTPQGDDTEQVLRRFASLQKETSHCAMPPIIDMDFILRRRGGATEAEEQEGIPQLRTVLNRDVSGESTPEITIDKEGEDPEAGVTEVISTRNENELEEQTQANQEEQEPVVQPTQISEEQPNNDQEAPKEQTADLGAKGHLKTIDENAAAEEESTATITPRAKSHSEEREAAGGSASSSANVSPDPRATGASDEPVNTDSTGKRKNKKKRASIAVEDQPKVCEDQYVPQTSNSKGKGKQAPRAAPQPNASPEKKDSRSSSNRKDLVWAKKTPQLVDENR